MEIPKFLYLGHGFFLEFSYTEVELCPNEAKTCVQVSFRIPVAASQRSKQHFSDEKVTTPTELTLQRKMAFYTISISEDFLPCPSFSQNSLHHDLQKTARQSLTCCTAPRVSFRYFCLFFQQDLLYQGWPQTHYIACMPKLCGTWDGTQGFKHIKQALYQLSCIPNPLFIVKTKVLKEAKMEGWSQFFSANPGSPLNVAKTEEAICSSWLPAYKDCLSGVLTNCSCSLWD